MWTLEFPVTRDPFWPRVDIVWKESEKTLCVCAFEGAGAKECAQVFLSKLTQEHGEEISKSHPIVGWRAIDLPWVEPLRNMVNKEVKEKKQVA